MRTTGYQIFYRDNSRWAAGNAYKTKDVAERYAKATGRDYKIERITKK